MDFDEPIQRGDRQSRVLVLEIRERFFQLSLLRQGGACCTPFELFIQLDGFFVLQIAHLVARFGIDFFYSPACGRVFVKGRTGRQQQRQKNSG